MQLRLAFWQSALGAFTDASKAERSYLGRIAQGFFAFHALGAFGDAAIERVQSARSTVWLVDSSIQIPALAKFSPSHRVYADAFTRLRDAHIPLYSSEKLFNETVEHLGFALQLVRRVGDVSPHIIAAASGEPPYGRQNVFLQGFIRWRAADLGDEWSAYLYETFGTRNPDSRAVRRLLKAQGVHIVDLQDWPGFEEQDHADSEAYLQTLKELMVRHHTPLASVDASFDEWLNAKLPPEAEAALIVRRERSGQYHVLSGQGEQSPAWFISATSIVNALERGEAITWQPESFLAFVGTLVAGTDAASSDRAFEAVLWGLAQSGLTPISEAAIAAAFDRVIDQAKLHLGEERQEYADTLG